jgi:hypothetical protein
MLRLLLTIIHVNLFLEQERKQVLVGPIYSVPQQFGHQNKTGEIRLFFLINKFV